MAHIHEKIDWTVSVFIVHKDEIEKRDDILDSIKYYALGALQTLGT